jgi:hypothetical protein
MIIVSATAEELKIVRDALIHAGARRNRNGLDAGMHRRLAETFQAALPEATGAANAAPDPVVRSGPTAAFAAVELRSRPTVILPLIPTTSAMGELVNALTSAVAAEGHPVEQVTSKWISTREAAKKWKCSPRTARRKAEKIGRKFGTDWFVSEESL